MPSLAALTNSYTVGTVTHLEVLIILPALGQVKVKEAVSTGTSVNREVITSITSGHPNIQSFLQNFKVLSGTFQKLPRKLK